jgi:hypothetical protein
VSRFTVSQNPGEEQTLIFRSEIRESKVKEEPPSKNRGLSIIADIWWPAECPLSDNSGRSDFLSIERI